MNLLYCSTNDRYYRKAQFDIATRQNGRLVEDDGHVIVRLGGRALPESVPWARIQRAICPDCSATLELVDIDPCPHTTDDQYWKVNMGNHPPTRRCELCGVTQTAVYVFE